MTLILRVGVRGILQALGGLTVFIAIGVLYAPPAYASDLPTSIYISICGDAIVEPGESCDDGFNVGGYGSTTAERKCLPGCQISGPYCGDGVLQVRFGEQCDDGNAIAGDLCDLLCRPETPSPPGGTGSPTRGGIPQNPGATQGQVPSQLETKVILRGKAYPFSEVSVLLDGKTIGTTQTDSNADFLFSTTQASPGIATFSFKSSDSEGNSSILNSLIFDVTQSAITTVANIFLPPTIRVTIREVVPGDLLNVKGQTVPLSKVHAQIHSDKVTMMDASADTRGVWALQIDTASLAKGLGSIKASFEISDVIKSGYGRSVAFIIGGKLPGSVSPDLNHDGKVNLIDFSIFLTDWNTESARSDFNTDTKVNLADFSIMLFAWTG